MEVLESGRDSATVLLKIITPYQVSIFGFSTPESHLCASDGKVPIHNLFLIVHSPLIKETSFLRRPPAGLKLRLAGWLWGRFAPP